VPRRAGDRRALRLLRRRPGGAERRLAVQEPLPPLRPPDLAARGDDLLGGLRRDPARGLRGAGRLRPGLRPPVDRGHRARLPPDAGGAPGAPLPRPAGDAPEALDAALAAAHRYLRPRDPLDRAAVARAGVHRGPQLADVEPG